MLDRIQDSRLQAGHRRDEQERRELRTRLAIAEAKLQAMAARATLCVRIGWILLLLLVPSTMRGWVMLYRDLSEAPAYFFYAGTGFHKTILPWLATSPPSFRSIDWNDLPEIR